MIIVITGGSGFIGSHLTERLLGRGDQVTVVDNFDPFYPESTKRANLAVSLGLGARLVEADIRAADRITATLASVRADVVVHLAAKAGVTPSVEDPLAYLETNVLGTLHVLDACRTAGTRNVIFGSSSSVYGMNRKVPFSESDPILSPASPYAASKVAGEALCHTFAHLHGLNITCLRFFTVYGPRQRPDMAIHKFARLLADGQPVPIFGADTARDYTYVSDIVDGILAAIDRPRPFAIYNLGDSRPISLDRMVGLLAEVLGAQARIERRSLRPGDVEITFADISRAAGEFGYRPTVPFEQGLRLFGDWFRAQRGTERDAQPAG